MATGRAGSRSRRGYPSGVPRNGKHAPRRPRIELRAPAATPDEAAAIAAAIEQFLRDTAPVPAPPSRSSGWARAAVLEGATLASASPDPWGDPAPWGRS